MSTDTPGPNLFDPTSFDPTSLDPTSFDTDGFLRRDRAAAIGTTDDQLARLVSDGELERVWRGIYGPADDLDADARYRRRVLAAARNGGQSRIVAFESAAALHRIPLYVPDRDKVHFIAEATGRHMPDAVVHEAKLLPHDIVESEGHPTTSLARTGCDVARQSSFRQAVAVLDSVCRLGVSDDELRDVIGRLKRHHGIATLRAAYPHASPLSENVGESVSKCVIRDMVDVPMPELQVEVTVRDGSIKRCDAGWRDASGRLRVVGEFDGKIKYHRLARDDERLPEDVIFLEKVREDALRDCDLIVVRWIWSDLMRPKEFRLRLRAALIRGGVLKV